MLIGGSGDPPGETTIFDKTAALVSTFVEQKEYSQTVLFNGDHLKTEKMLREKFSDPKPFSKEAYRKLISTFSKDQSERKSRFSKGDKVLLFINSHGEPGNYPQASHDIHCGDSLCDLDELNQLIAELEEENVQVAVVDAGCYSGPSVKLGSRKTCVLTSSREDSVGFARTNDLLAQELSAASNKNLEDVFLKAQSGFYGQGNINTEAGRETRKLLNQFFQEFKYTVKGDRFDFKSCRIDMVRTMRNFVDLKENIRKITGKVEPEFEQLEKAIREYQRRYERVNQLLGETEKLNETQIKISADSLSWHTLVGLSKAEIDKQIDQLSGNLSKVVNEIGKKEIADQIQWLRSLNSVKNGLRRNNSQFSKYEKDMVELKVLLSASRTVQEESLLMAQFKILDPEKSLYKKIYQSFPGKNNPCASFTL